MCFLEENMVPWYSIESNVIFYIIKPSLSQLTFSIRANSHRPNHLHQAVKDNNSTEGRQSTYLSSTNSNRAPRYKEIQHH